MQSTYLKEVVKMSLEDKSLFDSYHPDPVAKQSSPHQKLGSLLTEENLDPNTSMIILTVETDFDCEYGVFSSVCFFSNFFLKDAI